MSYTPRAGSIAARAHEQLTLRGELSGAALADAIEIDDAGTLLPSLSIALREGYIAKVKRDGLNFYSAGDGVRPLSPADEDDDPPVQRVVPAKAPAKHTKAAVTPSKAPLQLEKPFEVVFGVFTDGRVVIEGADNVIVLSPEESNRLRALMLAGLAYEVGA